MFRKLDKIAEVIGRICSWLSGISILIMMGLIVADVISRRVFKFNIKGGYDLVSILLILTVFFAISYTQQQKNSVHVTFILVHIKGKARYLIWAIGLLIADFMSGLFTYSCFSKGLLLKTIGTKFATFTVQYWIFYMLGTVCFALFTLILTFDVIRAFASLRNKECAEEVAKAWVS